MDNNDFNIGNENGVSKSILNKKIVIIGIGVLIILVLLYLLFNNLANNKTYYISYKTPSIMYMGEPLDIPVELKGSQKRINGVTTSFFSKSDGIVELPETEFYGENGSVLIMPLAPGEEDIVMVSTIGADKYNKVLATKTMHITVCPKFDTSLINQHEITLKKGYVKNLHINFGSKKCSEIVTYETDNSSVLSVTQEGVIRTLRVGKAKIIISNGSSIIEIVVNVIN